MMTVAKAQIRQANPKHAQENIDIIKQRWDYQMGWDVHLVGSVHSYNC